MATDLTTLPAAADELTAKQEAFAQRFAAHGNAAQSYRDVFDVSPGMLPNTVRQRAYELVHSPRVAARIQALRNAIAEQFVVSAAALKLRQYEVASAEPLSELRVYNCRHCNGAGHRYQWTDESELADAVAKAQAKPEPMPDARGLFGFDPFAPPAEDCPKCLGAGVPVVYLRDTRTLTAAQRAAFRGVSVDKWGVITIDQHDAQDAARELHRMIPGALAPQRTESKSVTVHVEPLKDMTPEQIVELMTQQKLIL